MSTLYLHVGRSNYLKASVIATPTCKLDGAWYKFDPPLALADDGIGVCEY